MQTEGIHWAVTSTGADVYLKDAEAAGRLERAIGGLAEKNRQLEREIDDLRKKLQALQHETLNAEQKAGRYTRTQRLVAQIMRETGVSHTTAARAVRLFGSDLDRAEREARTYATQIDRAEREVRELTAAQRAAAGQTGLASKLTAGLTGSIKSLGLQILAAVGLTALLSKGMRFLASEISAAITGFMQLEDSVVGLRKVTDGLGEPQLQQLVADLELLTSTTVPVAVADLTDLAATAGQIGIQSAEGLKVAATTGAQLAQATDIQGSQAITSLSRILAIQGEAISSIDNLGSALVALGNTSRATESQIEPIANEIARSTANFKLGSSTIFGYAAALAEVGAKAEGSGTALADLFNTLLKAAGTGEGLAGLAQVAGVSADELKRLAQSDISAAALQFLQGLARFGEQGALALDKVGLDSQRTAKALLPLAANIDRVRDRIELSNKEFSDNTALSKEADAAFNKLSADVQRVKNAYQLLTTDGIKALAPAISEMLRGIAAALVAWRQFAHDLGQIPVVAAVATLALGILEAKAIQTGENLAKLPRIAAALAAVSLEPLARALDGLATLPVQLGGLLPAGLASDLREVQASLFALAGAGREAGEGLGEDGAAGGSDDLAAVLAQLKAEMEAAMAGLDGVGEKSRNVRKEIIGQITDLEALIATYRETGEDIDDFQAMQKLMAEGFKGSATQALALVKRLRELSEQADRYRTAQDAVNEALSRKLELLPAITDPQPVEIDTSFTEATEAIEAQTAALAEEVAIMERFGLGSRQAALELEILRRQMQAGVKDASDLGQRIREATTEEFLLLDRIAGAGSSRAAAERTASDITGIIGGALRDLAENGEIDFDRLWNTFVDMGFQAIEAILQKWLATQFTSNVSLGGAGGVAGAAGGGGGGGLFGAGAGAISSALGVVAIAAAVWAIGKAVVARNEAKRFETPTRFDYGTSTSGAVTSNFAMNVGVWRALEDGVNAFRLAVGGFLADLPRMEIQVRNDGEKFRAAVAGVMLGTFDSAEAALEAALAAAFRGSTWTSGVGEEMARALGRISQVGLDAFAGLAPIISEIDLVSEGASASMARSLIARRQELTALDIQAEQLIRLGVAYDKVIAWREREIRAMIEQERRGLLGLAGVSNNAAAIADALARIAALRRALEEDRPPPEAHAGDAFFDRPVTGLPPGFSGGGGHGGTTGTGGGPGRGGPFDPSPDETDDLVVRQSMRANADAARDAAEAHDGLTGSMRDAERVSQAWQDDVADLDDSMEDAQLAAAGLTDAFIEMALDIARMEDQGSALSALLAFQEQYGIQIADNDKLRDRIARIEFEIAKRRLQLTLLEMAANAALYNLTAAQVAQYQRWAAEIGALDFSDVSRPRRQGRGPRPDTSDADREAADATRAAEQFGDILAELRGRLSGATDAARQYAAEQQRLRDLAAEGAVSAEDLNDALRIMAQLHLREIAADWAGSARAFAETDVGRAAREASQRARDALEAAMLAAVDAPDMYERVAAAIRDGLTAALHQIGRDAIGSLGSEFVSLRRQGMATVRQIRYLMDHLEELGLTAGQVGRVVAQAVLPGLLAMAIAEAERVGDLERAAKLRERQAEIERKLMLLQISLWEAQLEAAGALTDGIRQIIADLRADIERPDAPTPGEGPGPTAEPDAPTGPQPRRGTIDRSGWNQQRPGAELETAQAQLSDILRDLIYAAASPAEQARMDFERLRESILAAAGSEEDRARALILAQEAYDRKRLEGLRDLQAELLGEAVTARGGKQSFRAAQSAFEAAVAGGDEQAIEDAARLFLESAGGFTEASSQQAAANLARQQILAAIGPMLATLGGGTALGPEPSSALLGAQISGPGTALPPPAPIIIQQGPGMEALRAEISSLRAEVRALQSPGSVLDRTAVATEQTALRVSPMRELADFIRRRP